MSEFMIGCNYWASHAGTEMWLNWDEKQVDSDFAVLKENGIRYLRVFPNWRDFQPVEPLFCGAGELKEYMLTGNRKPENPYFLDETMLLRFEKLCDLAGKHNLKLIVGLVTGWMSGRLFIPPALYGKNLITDFTALYFEQKLVRGMAERFKDRNEIIAWDLGNECNCMQWVENPDVTYNWTATISNAIKAVDATRPVVSGMHGLSVDKKGWLIKDQGECTDILTTHPYAYFVPHCINDPQDSFRTLLHGTCETSLYSALGGKPCLVEEIGTLGNNICENSVSADFCRVNLLSNWAHGAMGMLWWCAHEQADLTTPPYSWVNLERELGLLNTDMTPKPFMKEMDSFGKWLSSLDFDLEKPKTDGVILLTKEQDQWGMAYMSYLLGKQAGATLGFVAPNSDIPDSPVYFMPSVAGSGYMYAEYDKQLRQKVKDGATLYVSVDDAFIFDRENFLGSAVRESENACDSGEFLLGDINIPYSRTRRVNNRILSAKVLAGDKDGLPIVTENRYGRGRVIYVNFPLEKNLISQNRAFDKDYYKLYEYALSQVLESKTVTADNKYVGVTENGNIVTLINYSSTPQKTNLKLKGGKKIDKIYRGDPENLASCDGAVFRIK